MTIHISLGSKNIVNLFPGTAKEAQKKGAKLLSDLGYHKISSLVKNHMKLESHMEDEINEMYKSTVYYLLDLKKESVIEEKMNEEYLLTYVDLYTKISVQTFYRSNVNRYKVQEDDFVNNMEYREEITPIVKQSILDYCKENNL